MILTASSLIFNGRHAWWSSQVHRRWQRLAIEQKRRPVAARWRNRSVLRIAFWHEFLNIIIFLERWLVSYKKSTEMLCSAYPISEPIDGYCVLMALSDLVVGFDGLCIFDEVPLTTCFVGAVLEFTSILLLFWNRMLLYSAYENEV